MSKLLRNIFLINTIFSLTFVLSSFVLQPTALAQAPGTAPGMRTCYKEDGTPFDYPASLQCPGGPGIGEEIVEGVKETAVTIGGNVVLNALGWVSVTVLQLVGFLTSLSGIILNYVVKFTVVDMAKYVSQNGDVDSAWSVIRDVANMGFIFLLLYASIQMIIGRGKNIQRLIVGTVAVAILINFSLFFTKIVIDASNVLAMTFYGAVAPNALGSDANLLQSGLSNTLMHPLRIQSIWQATGGLDITGENGEKLIIVGLMGSVVALVAAFVFFAMSILLVIRFVVLIFVLILSPLAFLSFILPQLDKYRTQWTDALIGQAFFAPIFFMLIWIVVKISRGLTNWSPDGSWVGVLNSGGLVSGSTNTGYNATGSIELVVIYLVAIAMLIAALVISKNWANRAGSGMASVTNWATGKAGAATFGGAGWVGRRTLGAGADRAANNQKLLDRASQEGTTGRIARLQLAASRKVAGASFDARNTSVGKSTIGAAGAGKGSGAGGFTKYIDNKNKEKAAFAESLKPSGAAINTAKRRLDEARTDEERREAQLELDRLKGVSPKEAEERVAALEIEKTRKIAEHEDVKKEAELDEKMKELDARRVEAEKSDDKSELITINEEIQKLNDVKNIAAESAKKAKEKIDSEFRPRIDATRPIDSAEKARKEAYARTVEMSWLGRLGGWNETAADTIRSSMKKKTKGGEIEEMINKAAEEKAKEANKNTQPAGNTEKEEGSGSSKQTT